ncbi:MAG: biopolymer transporter ExbD [Chitinophagaceae bacterium]
MKLRKRHKEGPEVFTDSLNDIIFILLMFFLIASTLANPNVIKLSQPKAKSDTKAKQSVVVSIDIDKNYFVGTTKVVGDSAMKKALLPFILKDSLNPTVVINADKTVPLEYVVGVMRVARDMGARTVLAVDKSAQ